jgi:hypothetical protein
MKAFQRLRKQQVEIMPVVYFVSIVKIFILPIPRRKNYLLLRFTILMARKFQWDTAITLFLKNPIQQVPAG